MSIDATALWAVTIGLGSLVGHLVSKYDPFDRTRDMSTERVPELLVKLLSCPFCGAGTTQIRENGRMWTGMQMSAPVSVSVLHFCEPVAGQPSRAIERVGRDHESAIAAWNHRTPGETT